MRGSMTTEPIRVLIADDHTIFREGLAALLQAAPNIAVVGEAPAGTIIEEAQGRLPSLQTIGMGTRE